MKRFILLIFCTLLIVGCSKDSIIEPPGQPDQPETEVQDEPYTPSPRIEGRAVIAYVTYYGTTLPDPRICTHINYAFAEIYMKNGKYRGFKLQGKEERFESVKQLKKENPDLKILLCFTNGVANPDNKSGEGFSVLAKDSTMRKAFAEDCKAFCKEHGIDGIDIDWEYPGLGWSGQAADVAVDTKNHVLLMKQLRETLGKEYLLSYAGYVTNMRAVEGGYKYIDIKALDSIVDHVNIMTYDLDANGKPHNAMRADNAYWDIVRTWNAYMAAGVSPEKMVLGIPFYGRISFSTSPGALSYKSIKQLNRNNYTIDNWDADACVPYVKYKNSIYCYYDNPRSIEYKASWALGRGMYGLMYWENDHDDSKFTLRRACWESVMKYKK